MRTRPRMKDQDHSVRLYFDSGAFGVWSRGETITVDEYGDFLEGHAHLAKGWANLDVIPGQRGKTTTDAEMDEAASASWKNYRRLVKRGLNPIPVYHAGERRYWLEKMLDEGCGYVGLGGVARVRDDRREQWLDEVFSFLCGDGGYPTVKVHGFGVTSVPLMYRYPWYSVDSVSWMLVGGMGLTLVPRRAPDGSYDYTQRPYAVGFGSRPSASGDDHYASLSPAVRSYVDQYLTGEGVAPDELLADRQTRVRLALRFFKRSLRAYTPRPFGVGRCGLFSSASPHGSPDPVGRFRVWFTITTSAPDNLLLHEEGLRTRLLSYDWFRGKPPFDLADFVRTGLIRSRGERARVQV